jgi:DNA-binding response OmpR family regulator
MAEVIRDGVLMSAEGGVVSAEVLLKQAWDENADPFTNAVRITVSALRNASANPGPSPPCPASDTASTRGQTAARSRTPRP